MAEEQYKIIVIKKDGTTETWETSFGSAEIDVGRLLYEGDFTKIEIINLWSNRNETS